MKISFAKTPLLPCIALGVGILLSSCVDPYYVEGRHSSQSITTYRGDGQIRRLPPGYRTVVVDGDNYYQHNGTYYRRQSGGYVVVKAPRSSYDRSPGYRGRPQAYRENSITRLPRGYREVNYRGNRYYQVNDVYYQRRGSVYVTVNRPY
jgi:hypothetical protein